MLPFVVGESETEVALAIMMNSSAAAAVVVKPDEEMSTGTAVGTRIAAVVVLLEVLVDVPIIVGATADVTLSLCCPCFPSRGVSRLFVCG